jgi:hypothetical protein
MLTTGSSGLAVQCQILVTVTCLLCELSVAFRQQRLFEGFVELLLGTVSRANAQFDAVLRSTACECLRELELVYPGLFRMLVGNFSVFVQTEMTFAHASYMSLLASTLTHAVLHARQSRYSRFVKKGSAVSLRVSPMQPTPQALQFLLPRPMIPFSIPLESSGSAGGGLGTSEDSLSFSASSSSSSLSFLGLPPSALSLGLDAPHVPPPDGVAQEIRRCVALMASDATSLLAAPQLFLFVMGLLQLQRVAGVEAVPSDLLRVNFFRLLDLGSPLLLHALLQIRASLPNLFEDSELTDDAHIVRKILACANDTTLALELRSESVRLAQEFGAAHCPEAFAHSWTELWPSVFDDYAVAAAKLRALALAFSPPSHPSPPNLLQALSCLGEFRLLHSSSFLARAVFATLRIVLARLPEQFDAVYRFLLDLLVYSPQFLSNLTDSLDLASPVTHRLLTNFNQLLCGLETAKLRDYVPLADLICRVEAIDGTLLLDRVLTFVRSHHFDEHLDLLGKDDRWRFGDSLLQLCRSAAAVQSPARLTVWELLCQLLFFLSQRFPDVEIRERAFFLHQVVTHLSPAKAAILLSASSDLTAPAELFSGSTGAKIPPPVVVARPFLCFDRVAGVPVVGGEDPARWSWAEVCQHPVASPSDLEQSQAQAFLSAPSFSASDLLAIRLRLRFLRLEELEEQDRKRSSRASSAAPSSNNKSGSTKKKKDASEPAANGVLQPVAKVDALPTCVLGACVSFQPHPNFVAQTKVEADILRANDKAMDVVLSLRVVVPVPGALESFAEFSFVPADGTRSCVVARASLTKFVVELPDLLAELPDASADSSLTLPVARVVFDKLWARKEPNCAESVKRLPYVRKRVEEVLLGAFRKFVLVWNNADCAKICIFLPPSSHCLLIVQFGEDASLVSIKTDLWQVLESVELYMESLFKK